MLKACDFASILFFPLLGRREHVKNSEHQSTQQSNLECAQHFCVCNDGCTMHHREMQQVCAETQTKGKANTD